MFLARRVLTVLNVTETITSSKSWTVPAGCNKIDAFLVGGGGAAGGRYGAGGGGGYTVTVLNIATTPGESLTINIGAGGVAASDRGKGGDGNPSRILRGGTVLAEAAGGYGGGVRSTEEGVSVGGNGGSGGGGAAGKTIASGSDGGSDGSDGRTENIGGGSTLVPGTGQHTSTRCPFNDVLYAGGGGGARWMTSNGVNYGEGGAGGGGRAWMDTAGSGFGMAGTANTGGGGGGCWGDLSSDRGGAGGSGIVVLHYFKH